MEKTPKGLLAWKFIPRPKKVSRFSSSCFYSFMFLLLSQPWVPREPTLTSIGGRHLPTTAIPQDHPTNQQHPPLAVTLMWLLPTPQHLHTIHTNSHLTHYPTLSQADMEALWSLEDKWKLSTQEAVLLFVCTAFSVIGVCTAVTLKKRARRRQVVGGEDVDGVESMISKKWGDGGCGWGSIKRVLMGTVRWSGASKWDERPLPLLAVQQYEGDVGWQSHNSVSPVWQRPILMGEKCELPRFSGLILYDETGQPLHQPDKETIQQVSKTRSRRRI